MKKVVFTLGVCLLANFGIAQTKNKFTDTSMAVGVIAENFTGYSEQLSEYCMNNSGKYLNAGEAVVIAGIDYCVWKNDTTHFYKIVIDSTILYVLREQIKTEKLLYSQIANLNAQQKTNLEKKAKYYARAVKYGNIQRLSKFYKTCEQKGLRLLEWELYDESEYTKGTGIKFIISNTGKKTIKYISFTVVGINPVGDAVMAKTGVYPITLKGVGPIEPDEAATFSFDYTWMSDLPETANIKSIKVQFMDNTFSTISNPKEIIMSEELKTISERLDK